jgi:acyl-CoA thioesterase I
VRGCRPTLRRLRAPPHPARERADLSPQSPGQARGGRGKYGAFVLAALLLLASTIQALAAHSSVILVIGDSLTAGYGLPQDEAFPEQLQARLRQNGAEVRVVNGGVSGDTTAGGLVRLDWMLAEKPDYVLLALGANDALRGIPPATVRDNLDKTIRKVKASGAKLLLVGMRAPANWGEGYQTAFDRIFPDLARSDDVPLYPFFLEGVAMDPRLNQADGEHPNARGVAVMVDRLAPVVLRLIGGRS